MHNIPSNQPRIDPKKHSTPTFFLLVAVVSFLITVVLFVAIIFYKHSLVGILGDRAYYILLFPLGFSCAAFLFGVMNSFATYQGKVLNGILKLGGPIIIFIAVVAGGYYLPVNNSFDFNITLEPASKITASPHYPAFENATLKIHIGNDWKVAKQLPNGDFDFKEIPGEFRNEWVRIKLTAAYWQLITDSVQLTGKSNVAGIVPNGSLSFIEGIVREGKIGAPIAGVIVQTAGITDTSDNNGYFSLKIPAELQTAEGYVDCVANGFRPAHVPVTPATGKPLDITMSYR